MGNRPICIWCFRVICITLFWVNLTGCSALDFIKPAPGIEVETQIGKDVEKTVGIKTETDVAGNNTTAYKNTSFVIAPENIESEGVVVGKGAASETIEQTGEVVASSIENLTVEAPLPLVFLLLLIGGWLSPTPRRTYRMIKGMINGKKGK